MCVNNITDNGWVDDWGSMTHSTSQVMLNQAANKEASNIISSKIESVDFS